MVIYSKLLLIFTFIAIPFLFLHSQTKTDFTSMPGVLEIKENKYTISVNSIKNLVDVIYYKFDSKGYLKELNLDTKEKVNIIKFNYNYDDKLISEKGYNKSVLSYRIDFEYDDYGNLSEEIFYDSKNNQVSTNKIKYNSKGLVSEKISDVSVRFSLKNFYNTNNKLYKTEILSTSSIKKEIEYYYNNLGLLSSETIYTLWKNNPSAKKYRISKVEYEYNSDNTLKEKKYFITDKVTEAFKYYYNDKGYLEKWEKYNSQGKLVYVVDYEYIYS